MSSLTKRQQVCSMCEAEPDDMLILTCRHNLCLDCATELYNLNTKNDQILCEICLSSTPLDQDTIVCLRSLSAKAINQNGIPFNNNNNNAYQQTNLHPPQYPPMPRSHYVPTNPQPLALIPQQPSMPPCQKHNQPLTYYCLQCHIYTICSQCMLLDNHRYHKVVTIKKASLQIRQTIEKVGRQKLKLKSLLEKDRQSLISRKQESQKQLEVNLLQLKGVFDEVMRIVGRRYDEMRINVDKEAQRKLQIMQGAINQIQQKVQLIQQTIQFQQQLIKSCTTGQQLTPALQMFDYYESQIAKNSLSFQPSLPNFISQVYPQKIANKQKLLSQIDSLLGGLLTVSEDSQRSQDNINLMSQIGDDNLVGDVTERHKVEPMKHRIESMKKRTGHEENVYLVNDLHQKKPISQNINIIHSGPSSQYGIRQKKQGNILPAKKSSIQTIKRKARQNMKDRQLSHSRKMELSRSIQNATDILNKIQERTAKA